MANPMIHAQWDSRSNVDRGCRREIKSANGLSCDCPQPVEVTHFSKGCKKATFGKKTTFYVLVTCTACRKQLKL